MVCPTHPRNGRVFPNFSNSRSKTSREPPPPRILSRNRNRFSSWNVLAFIFVLAVPHPSEPTLDCILSSWASRYSPRSALPQILSRGNQSEQNFHVHECLQGVAQVFILLLLIAVFDQHVWLSIGPKRSVWGGRDVCMRVYVVPELRNVPPLDSEKIVPNFQTELSGPENARITNEDMCSGLVFSRTMRSYVQG